MILGIGAEFSVSQGIVTGSVSGLAQDPSSAVVQGAAVTAVQDATNSSFRTKTNASGDFQLPNLPIGAYTVTIECSGFVSLRVENVIVQTGTPTSLGILTLKLGATAEAITVEGASALLQPDSVQLSQQFDTQKTADLPIGNGFDIVALLTPGVAPSGGKISLPTTMARSFRATVFEIGTIIFNSMDKPTTTQT